MCWFAYSLFFPDSNKKTEKYVARPEHVAQGARELSHKIYMSFILSSCQKNNASLAEADNNIFVCQMHQTM